MAAIRYLLRRQIHNERWNQCIDAAANGLIYGYTSYLDAMCSNWSALVLDDYEAVMPLPWRKKWGVCYLYQPFATAQLGLFGRAVSAELLHGFLKNIPAFFRYWDVPLNYGNRFALPHYPLYERTNFILNLNEAYETLQAAYRPYIRRNIKKAAAQHGTVHTGIAINLVTELAKAHAATNVHAADVRRFINLYAELAHQGKAVSYGVTAATGAVLASAVFFFSHRRAYYILAGNPRHARSTGASHLLIDRFIKDHAAQNLILDFEGSDVPSLQFFYSSFGAVPETYTAIKYNRLPFFAKWLKT